MKPVFNDLFLCKIFKCISVDFFFLDIFKLEFFSVIVRKNTQTASFQLFARFIPCETVMDRPFVQMNRPIGTLWVGVGVHVDQPNAVPPTRILRGESDADSRLLAISQLATHHYVPSEMWRAAAVRRLKAQRAAGRLAAFDLFSFKGFKCSPRLYA